MSAWKKFEDVVSAGEEKEFLNSVKNYPAMVRMAYAIALTIAQMNVHKKAGMTTYVHALCLHHEQCCKKCLACRDGKCWLSEECPVDSEIFAWRLYERVMSKIPEMFRDGDQTPKS